MSFKVEISDPLEIAAFTFLVGGGLIYKSLRNFQRLRKVQDTAKINIASAPAGLVEVEGYAWPAGDMARDRFNRHAIYLDYRLEEYVRRGDNSRWETVFKFHHETPFYILDHTGVCLIDPSKDCMELHERTIPLNGYPRNHEELIKITTQPQGFFSTLFKKQFRIIEKKILLGAPVYACGSMQITSNNNSIVYGDYKKFLEAVKIFKVNPLLQLRKLDLNKDGKVSDQELSEGLCTLATGCQSSLENKTQVVGVITDTKEHDLIVGDCHQAQLSERLSNFNMLKLVGGVALVGIGLYVLQNYFRIK